MLYVKDFTKDFANYSVCFYKILLAFVETFVKIDYLSSKP